MFTNLYSFNFDLGVKPYFSVSDFMGWVFSSSVLAGILFETPIIMWLCSFLHITTPHFWMRRWKEFFMLFLIVSSILTPDTSGMSVLLLLLPGAALYGVGIMLSLFSFKKRYYS